MPIEIKGYVNVHTPGDIDLECFKSDYIITLSDPRTFRWKWDKEIILKLHQLLKENSKFVLVKEFKMPFYMSKSGEGDEKVRYINVLYIYKRLNGRDVKID